MNESLINFRRDPVFATFRGTDAGTSAGGSAANVLVPFANTFISSKEITRNSATRITVNKPGWYQLDFPLRILSSSTTFETNLTLQVGINGGFFTITATPGLVYTEFTNDFMKGWYSVVLENLSANDYIEILSIASQPNRFGHLVQCTNDELTGGVGIHPTGSIRRI